MVSSATAIKPVSAAAASSHAGAPLLLSPGLPCMRAEPSRYAKTSSRASVAASAVRSMAASSWARDTNQASNWEAGG